MYVDALQINETINVVERGADGKRVYKEYPADYHVFVNDPKGSHKTIYGNTVKKLQPRTKAERTKLIKMHRQTHIWESDMNPVTRCLEQEYLGKDFPDLNVAFFDIETDFDQKHGYSSPTDALNPIISIAVYMQWLDQMVCVAVPPKGMSMEQAQAISSEVNDTIIVETEGEMLDMFLTLIEDADVISGWNCEFFDRPYLVGRIIKILGKHETRRLCLWDQKPKKKIIERGGKEEVAYETIGRISLDYMQLYKNYSYEERHSYALDNIAREELNSQKTPYDGTLDQLYNQDFKLFLEYNIQDTKLLDELDKKLQYIDLASAIAHGNAVSLPATMSAVATTEQAIVCEAHAQGMVVPNKKRKRADADPLGSKAAGGWVSQPKKGLHKWVGSSDLNSLYPSVIRALNMSTETLVGHVRCHHTDEAIAEWCEKKGVKYTFASWWNDRFNTLEMGNFFSGDEPDKADVLYLDMANGDTHQLTTAELKALIFDSGKPWAISANGTVFRTDKEGVIPGLLRRWYTERQQMQAVVGAYRDLIVNDKGEGTQLDNSFFKEDTGIPKVNEFNVNEAYSPKKLLELIAEDDFDRASYYMNEHNLYFVDGFVRAKDQARAKEVISYWDKRQLVRKINLNSVYGGLLNEHHRFFDKRIGQSTTLTGRCITKHMTAKTNELLTGDYDYNGICAIYNDTDSVYFSAWPAVKADVESGALSWDKEKVISLYDEVSDIVSESFPQWMLDTFHVPFAQGGVIKSGREVVAETGLFIKKKRYAALVIDNEGKRQDVGGKPGKIKVTGLDLRRADTPKFVQEFLMGILTRVLTGAEEREIVLEVRKFKEEFNGLQPWQRGIPKGVNRITHYMNTEMEVIRQKQKGHETKGFTVPGHVRGAINWNMLKDRNNDLYTTKILDGSKVIVCYLLETEDNPMTNIAYPVDELKLPDWFTSLPFDVDRMEHAVVDNKVKNLLSVLKWDLERTSKDAEHMESLFDFGDL